MILDIGFEETNQSLDAEFEEKNQSVDANFGEVQVVPSGSGGKLYRHDIYLFDDGATLLDCYVTLINNDPTDYSARAPRDPDGYPIIWDENDDFVISHLSVLTNALYEHAISATGSYEPGSGGGLIYCPIVAVRVSNGRIMIGYIKESHYDADYIEFTFEHPYIMDVYDTVTEITF